MSLFPLDVPLVPHTVARASNVMGGTTITTGGVAHTKTGWIQFTPNTAADTYLIRVYIDATSISAADSSALLDIAIGNLGSEVVICANLLIGNTKISLNAGSSNPGATFYDIPIFVPAGTRIAGRIQGAPLSTAYNVGLDLFGGPSMLGTPFMGAAVDTYGALTASSHGTSVAAGVSGAAGAWTQIAASTTSDYRALLLGVDAAGNATVLADNFTVDVGVGAAASEVSILPAGYAQGSSGTAESVDMRCPAGHLLWLPSPIPSGTRLSARISQSAVGAQSYGVALYGVR